MIDHAESAAHTWEIDHSPTRQAVEALRSHLVAHNVEQAAIDAGQEVAVFVRGEEGQLVGGIVGWMWGQCLEINYLWVHPDVRGRGYGKRLVETVEAEARGHGCRTAILDTYTFQAPAFYQKLGYEVLFAVEGYPRGYQKLFLKKCL